MSSVEKIFCWGLVILGAVMQIWIFGSIAIGSVLSLLEVRL